MVISQEQEKKRTFQVIFSSFFKGSSQNDCLHGLLESTLLLFQKMLLMKISFSVRNDVNLSVTEVCRDYNERYDQSDNDLKVVFTENTNYFNSFFNLPILTI